MKDIDYGNYLYELRKENKLTQRFVAYQLSVSDKAVSKWETGKSKPDLDKLKLLATLYNVPLNELLEEVNKVPSMEECIQEINNSNKQVIFESPAQNCKKNFKRKRFFS